MCIFRAFPTNESFIRFYVAGHLVNASRVYRVANPLKHKPCGTLSHLNRTGEFITTDPVLAIGQQPHRSKPFTQWDGRILKDRPNLHRELFLTAKAFPHKPCGQKRQAFRGALRTLRTLWPFGMAHSFKANLRVREILNSGLQPFREFGVNRFHASIIQLRYG